MNKYAELRQRQQKEFDSLPLGFAFSQKQFNEMMEGWGLDPEKDLDKILRIPGGGYVQKKDADLLHQTVERHDTEMAEAIAEDKTGEGFIYEMFLYNLDVDTASYDSDLRRLWDAVAADEEDTADWSDFDSFDSFMCRYLV